MAFNLFIRYNATMIKRIYIEITNRCNLSCSFCAKHKRVFNDLNINQFEAILKQVKPLTPYIYLHVQGEPLMHPNIDDFLSLCDLYDMQVQLTTNATLLAMHPALLEHCSIRKLALSLHAYDELSLDLEKLLNNIEHLIQTKKPHQYIELRFWNKDALKDNCALIIDFLKKRYSFKPTNKPMSYELAPQLYLHYDFQFKWPSENQQLNTKGTCKGVKSMLCILSNGDVTPCCLDENAVILLGNIFTDSLENILKSPRYLQMMQGLNEHKLIEPLCQSCSYRNRFN